MRWRRISFVSAASARSTPAPPTTDCVLRTRVWTALVALPALLALVLFAPAPWFAAFVGVLTAWGLYEVGAMTWARTPGAIGALRQECDRLLPQIAGAPLVAISAISGEGLPRLLPAVLAADAAWNRRIPTADLNRLLAIALERHPPPAISGRRIRLRYITQAKVRPPTFALFGNQLKALPDAWLRYMQNELRATFDFGGTPLRLLLRTTKNPYTQDRG